MVKRWREDDPTQIVTEEALRGAKRQAAGGGAVPENPGRSAAKGQLLPAPPLPHGYSPGEPLRPANQAAAHDDESAVPQGAAAQQQQQQQAADHHRHHQQAAQQHHHQHPSHSLDSLDSAAAAAAAAGCSIDWHNPQQVAQLLRWLHLERLRRHGQALPPEYEQPQRPS